MARPQPLREATIEDFYAIPEGERRHELIDGELIEKEATSGEHGTTQHNTQVLLGPFSGSGKLRGMNGPGGWWFGTEVEVLLSPRFLARPDVTGWRKDRSPKPPSGTPIALRPDWTCEILSSNRANDTVRKRRAYHLAGIPHYWILDPEARTLEVNRWTPDGYTTVLAAEAHETVRPEPFDELEFKVSEFFSDADDP